MDQFTFNLDRFYSRKALQSIDVDATKLFNIPSIVLMENASINASKIICEYVDKEDQQEIVILCGSGSNGGDGYGVARHLVIAGRKVSIFQLGEPESADAKVQASICKAMNIPISLWSVDTWSEATLFIDAIFGTGIDRPVSGQFLEIIQACNAHVSPCVSLDIPSGMDCDSGIPYGCCIEAIMTISFVGMKLGFGVESAQRFLGKVLITDIGCPNTLLTKYSKTTT